MPIALIQRSTIHQHETLVSTDIMFHGLDLSVYFGASRMTPHWVVTHGARVSAITMSLGVLKYGEV